MKNLKSFIFFIILFNLFGKTFSFTKTFDAKFKILNNIKKIPSETLVEKSIVAVIPSFNNKNWLERNLGSIFSQEYKNYKIIYIDDCSIDGTADFVEKFVKENKQEHRFTLIRNDRRKGALENLWRGIHMCQDMDIVATVDGDDWLADKDVFKVLNEVYSDINIWMTYGQFKVYPANAIGWCTKVPDDIIKNHAYRKFEHIPSHLRTFYAGLFKQIKMKDLVNFNGFYAMAWDIAMMIPMIEMADERHKFISRVLYDYNDDTPLNDHKVNKQLQTYLGNVLRAKKPYERLKETFIDNKNLNQADILIFSQESPASLLATIESIKKYAKGIGQIFVIYRAKDSDSSSGYQKVENIFSDVKYYKVNTRIPYYLKHISSKVSQLLKTDYILISGDNSILTDYVDLSTCMKAMKKTHALGFYLRLGKNITHCYPYKWAQKMPKTYETDTNVYGWIYQYAEGDWAYPINFEMTIFNKNIVQEILQTGHFNDISNLELIWGSNTDLDNVGLCFEYSKAIKFISKDQKEISDKFKIGYKLDLNQLDQIDNITARIEWEPQFINYN